MLSSSEGPLSVQIGVMIGGVLITVPMCIAWYYGNLLVYLDSYYVNKNGLEGHTVGALWVVTLFAVGLNAGAPIGGLLSTKIGPHLTTIVGLFVFNLSMYMTYFAVQVHVWAMNVTLGLLPGLCCGTCYAMILLYSATWIPKRVAFASAVGTSGIGGGAILLNYVVTVFINPHKLTPDLSSGATKLFSQTDLLDRVPYIFLVLSGISTVCHLIALPLFKPHPTFKKTKICAFWIKTPRSYDIESAELYVKGNGPDGGSVKSYTSTDPTCNGNLGTGNTTKGNKNENTNEENNDESRKNLTPREMLKRPQFYMLTISLCLLLIGYLVENNYYKQFGLLYIPDDYFITAVGTAVTFAVLIGRIMWGLLLDKVSANLVLNVVSSVHAICLLFWYFTPMISKWLFLFVTVAAQAAQSAVLVAFPVTTLLAFGPRHYVSNYGLVLSTGSIVFLAMPPLMNVLLNNCGWFYVFTFASVASVIALVLCSLLPKYQRPQGRK